MDGPNAKIKGGCVNLKLGRRGKIILIVDITCERSPPFKVAGAYLCQNSRTGMVNYTAVRDILHKHFSESQNKTSRACQRRLNYMLKNDTTADNVRLFLADVQRDSTVRKGGPMKCVCVGGGMHK